MRRLSALFAVLACLALAEPAFAVVVDEPIPHSSLTAVNCTSPVAVGVAVNCTATVQDLSPAEIAVTPRGTINFTTNAAGTFAGECALRTVSTGVARCSISYTPNAPGTHAITAGFFGQNGNSDTPGLEPSEGTGQVIALAQDPTTTTVACDRNVLTPGTASRCTATVTDPAPAQPTPQPGELRFTSDGDGTFNLTNCLVAFGGGPGSETVTCRFSYTPRTATAAHRITASYRGDASHNASQASVQLQPNPVILNCDPVVLETAGKPARCTVAVEDPSATPTTPTGRVDFTSSDEGSFSAPNCELIAESNRRASCEVVYTPTAIGSGFHRLTAAYRGDAAHQPGFAVRAIRVGAVRYAAPNGIGLDPCANPEEPCSLFVAASTQAPGTTVGPGAEIVLAPGTYDEIFGPSNQISLPESVRIHGTPGEPRPVIRLLAERGGGRALRANRDNHVSYLEIIGSAETPLTAKTGIVENVIVRTSGVGRGVFACSQDQQRNGRLVIRDSACITTGTDGTAVGFAALGETEMSMTLRNVTAVSTGPRSYGLRFIAQTETENGAIEKPNVRVDAIGVIAQGTIQDVAGESFTLPPQEFGTGGRISVELDNSNYASTQEFTDLSGGVVAITPPAAESNIALRPRLAPDGYHQLPGSVTIDTGAIGLDSGRFDIDGQARFAGKAPDMGADELVGELTTTTNLSCAPATPAAQTLTTCTAVVADGEGGAPTGIVRFSHTNQGTFPADPIGGEAVCELLRVNNVSSCSVTYRPAVAGLHRISANYPGDAGRAPSSDAFDLAAGEPGGGGEDDGRATLSTLTCAPNPIASGNPTACTATVKDDGGPGATAPTGKVAFQSNAQGAFSATPAECTLAPLPAPNTDSSACQLTYTPAGAAATHELRAAYTSDDADHAVSTDTFDLAVLAGGGGPDNRNATTTDLTCNPSPVIFGGGSVCTAVVADTGAAPRRVPTGTVGFTTNGPGGFADGCTLAPAGPATARCQAVYVPTAVGDAPHRITAAYQGDENHRPSEDSAQVTVLPPNGGSDTETELTCEPPNVFLGGASVCTVDVEDLDAPLTAPTGEIAFASTSAGDFEPASCTLFSLGNGRSRCQLLYTPAQTGNHRVTALYPGDAGHGPSRASADLTVVPPNGGHRTTTAIACNPAAVSLGGQTVCTATVTDTDANPTTPRRQVVFASNSPGTFSAGGCVLTAAGAGRATCTITYTPRQVGTGTHKLTAVYEGDPTHEPSLGETEVTVTNAPTGPHQNATATELVCAPDPVASGNPATCTATVTDVATTGVKEAPSGQISFETNAQGAFNPEPACNLAPVGPAAPNSSRCQVTYTATGPAAVHQLKATYVFDDIEHTTSNDTFDLDVLAGGGGGGDGKNDTIADLTCAPASVILGGRAVCTVLVTDTAAADRSVPDGVVDFETDGAGDFPIGCNLAPTGEEGEARCQALYRPTAVGAGTHEITADYAGDADHESAGDSTDLTVAGLNGGHTTSTALECEPFNVILGGVSICTVDVRDHSATPTAPSGGVFFATNQAGDFSSGGCFLFSVGPGEARCQLIYKPTRESPPAHQITAVYSGDAGHEPSQGSDLVIVALPAAGAHRTTTALQCQPARVAIGAVATCTATVTDVEANPTDPTRAVVFASDGPGTFDRGGCQLGQPNGDAQATCTFTYRPSQVGSGTHRIAAAYEGDPGHEPSPLTFAQLTVTAVADPPPPPPQQPGQPQQPQPPQATPQPAAAGAPNTTLRKKPRKKTAVRKAKFLFASDQAGSSFQCKLDKKPFKPCRTPWKKKVKAGRHSFQVRAVNAQGLVDPTPASFKWKVGKVARPKR